MGDRELRLLRQTLRAIDFGPSFLTKLARTGERLDDALRTPIRIWHARRMPEPAAIATRLFVLGDSVAGDELRRAFGDAADLVVRGLAEKHGEGWVSRVTMAFSGDGCLVGDRSRGEPTGVPPLGGGTLTLLAAAAPHERVENALDLGCGAGAVALALATRAARVVATDVSARALALARINACINGVANVEWREGDLFEPVAGEQFDLIASQPPFIACPPGCAPSVYAHGGPRGDELVMRALSAAADHIAPRGRLVLLADVPIVDEDPLEERLRDVARDEGLRIVVLQSPPKNLDEYCVFHAAVDHPLLDEGFTQAVLAQREHLERLRIRGIALSLFVAQPAPKAPFVTIVPVRHPGDARITSVAVDRILAAHSLAHAEEAPILGSRLRWPEGSRLASQPLPPDAGGSSLLVHLPPDRPQWPIVLDERTASVVSRITRSASVLDAARALARDEDMPLEQCVALVVAGAREALSRGALEVEQHAAG